ncbi:MAG: hypothetical protein WC824_11280 [Bacteroidota bacterium]|jgi:hypothetical protein
METPRKPISERELYEKLLAEQNAEAQKIPVEFAGGFNPWRYPGYSPLTRMFLDEDGDHDLNAFFLALFEDLSKGYCVEYLEHPTKGHWGFLLSSGWVRFMDFKLSYIDTEDVKVEVAGLFGLTPENLLAKLKDREGRIWLSEFWALSPEQQCNQKQDLGWVRPSKVEGG